MFARVRATLGLEVLILAVHALFHTSPQHALRVAGEQRIPTRAPHHLDDVPTGTEECSFEFLNDLAVAAHWSVEALQVAVDYEHEIVEFLAYRHGECAHRFGLIHFAVAQERPDLAIGLGNDAAMLEVTLKASLIDRHHGT